MATDPELAPIVRATAVGYLARIGDPRALGRVVDRLGDEAALVRLSALESLAAADAARLYPWVGPLLRDPMRAVRIAATPLLAPLSLQSMPQGPAEELGAAFAAYESLERQALDRPEALNRLAAFLRGRGRPAEAENLYLEAVERYPAFEASYVNLADLFRLSGRDGAGEALLRQGISRVVGGAEIAHALGLLLIRGGRHADALPALARAVELAAESAAKRYAYALALERVGRPQEALEVLQEGLARRPDDSLLLDSIVAMSLRSGDRLGARDYLARRLGLDPGDPYLIRLIETFEK